MGTDDIQKLERRLQETNRKIEKEEHKRFYLSLICTIPVVAVILFICDVREIHEILAGSVSISFLAPIILEIITSAVTYFFTDIRSLEDYREFTKKELWRLERLNSASDSELSDLMDYIEVIKSKRK